MYLRKNYYSFYKNTEKKFIEKTWTQFKFDVIVEFRLNSCSCTVL